MAAAERVVRAGGTIVMAAACADGTPDGGAFARLLAEAPGPDALDAADRRPSETDRWQAQVLGRVLRHAEVWLHTDGLTDDEVRGAFLRPVADVTDAVAEALDAAGRDAAPGSASSPTDRSPSRRRPDLGDPTSATRPRDPAHLRPEPLRSL